MTLTIFGVIVLTFMMLMYALERRAPRFVLAFALGCALSSAYGFLSGAWPFGYGRSVVGEHLLVGYQVNSGGPTTHWPSPYPPPTLTLNRNADAPNWPVTCQHPGTEKSSVDVSQAPRSS